MGNFSDVVYYSLLAAYGRMLSNPVTILFMSHVKTAHQSALNITKYKGFSFFSHGRSGKATEEAQLLQFLNLDKICWPPIKVNIFPKNEHLRENSEALKLTFEGSDENKRLKRNSLSESQDKIKNFDSFKSSNYIHKY